MVPAAIAAAAKKVVDVVSHLVDQRVRVSDVTAGSALTRDTVPVNVDAIVFWTVRDAKKSILEARPASFPVRPRPRAPSAS